MKFVLKAGKIPEGLELNTGGALFKGYLLQANCPNQMLFENFENIMKNILNGKTLYTCQFRLHKNGFF